MEQQFNINKVLERYKPNVNELAKVLFPSAKHPHLAFSRVVKGEAALDAVQLQSLASYLGILISDLFEVAEDWKAEIDKNHLIFVNGPYKVRLNYQGAFLVLYKDDKLVKRAVLNTSSMLLTDFIDYINNLIKNY